MSEENSLSGNPTWLRLGALVTLLLASIIFCWYFDGLMLNPNQKAPTFGGDGLTIHYNLQYHATYGKGPFLTSQYYPHRESIFMTDAQGVLAVALAELRDVFPGIEDYSAGISNVLVFWSNPIAALLLFLLFFRLGVRPGWAVVFALLVSMLSPHIYRQVCGHYALGYSFLFPLLLLYLFSRSEGWRLLGFSALMVGVIFILGLNNPYLFAITGAFLLASLGLAVLMRLLGKPVLGTGRMLHWLGVVVISGGAIMWVLAATDIVEDRVQVPYGFFTNTMKLKGLLSSPDVLGADLANWIDGNEADPPRESRTFLGWISILFLLVAPFAWLFRKRLAPASSPNEGDSARPALTDVFLPDNPRIWLLLGGGLLALLFSFGLPFEWFREWSYDHLGRILQFRAPARFAWPFYYVLAVAAALSVHLAWSHFTERKNRIGQIIILVVLGVWTLQAHQYVTSSLDGRIHHNGFRPSSLAPLEAIAEEHAINSAEYQGIYLLPTEHGWTDKLQHPGVWRSNYNGYQLSVITGLPLINGKLSRMSLAQSLASMQLVSHPLLKRPLLDILDADRDILLLASREDDLDPGEANLFAAGTPVYEDEKIGLRKISVADLRSLHRTSVDSTLNQAADTLGRARRHDFSTGTDRTYFGEQAGKFPSGTSEIWDLPINPDLWSDSVEVSVWTYADPVRSGGPRFTLRVFGQENERIHKMRRWTNESFDTDRGWLRVNMAFRMPPGATRLTLEGDFYYHYWLDELWLRPVAEDICLRAGRELLCNNFRVE
ncbi:hypothetical protein [Lewinella sp. W8]|uniref:hypothetical protein n=1 Tax=Lewinella sp. W8 TaxID=2528208 RepID=UPI0010679935|nr:hypothetical protein [Lewinella sp. W8]MTB49511.1 hypothetical protein [Lewinella sp. W8]